MQIKKEVLYKEICKLYPELDMDYVKHYILFVLDGIQNWSMNPDNLILKVKHFGVFHWKFKNLKKDLESKKFFADAEAYKRGAEHINFVNVAEGVVEMYADYHEKKYRIRKLNYGADYKTPEQLTIEKKAFLNKANDKNTRKVLI